VLEDFGEAINGVIEGGSCLHGLESTILLLEPEPLILRPGAITKEELERVLRCSIGYAQPSERPLAPGMKYRHYAPRAQVCLFNSLDALESYLADVPSKKRKIVRELESSQLYAIFRQADIEQQEEILILCTEAMQHDAALMNRLYHASLPLFSLSQ
jgi:L-threonylcarbamoyladenylate synthase